MPERRIRSWEFSACCYTIPAGFSVFEGREFEGRRHLQRINLDRCDRELHVIVGGHSLLRKSADWSMACKTVPNSRICEYEGYQDILTIDRKHYGEISAKCLGIFLTLREELAA